jgi:hypothetical protein
VSLFLSFLSSFLSHSNSLSPPVSLSPSRARSLTHTRLSLLRVLSRTLRYDPLCLSYVCIHTHTHTDTHTHTHTHVCVCVCVSVSVCVYKYIYIKRTRSSERPHILYKDSCTLSRVAPTAWSKRTHSSHILLSRVAPTAF